VRLRGVSGLDFHADLLRQGETLPVIFMTGHGDIPMSVRAMKAGAVDFLAKPFREQDLLDAVAAALDGDRRRRADHDAGAELRNRYESLTPREREVLAELVTGTDSRHLARRLVLSEHTVNDHIKAILAKTGAPTRPTLLARVAGTG